VHVALLRSIALAECGISYDMLTEEKTRNGIVKGRTCINGAITETLRARVTRIFESSTCDTRSRWALNTPAAPGGNLHFLLQIVNAGLA
jgi:hypothetical protein